jgi:GR25 family glycosyltransferase involved in LPS biosynthesis
VRRSGVTGSIRDGEKGCFISHRRAIELSRSLQGHVLIVEDDATLGSHACHLINGAIAGLPMEGWDLLFTDVCIASPPQMLELFMLRRALVAAAQFKCLDLKTLRFAGSTAYIVHERAKDKLLAAVENASALDSPYDLFLRRLIYQSTLAARVIFPFATSISIHAEESSIQIADARVHEVAWNAFRRLMWADRQSAEIPRLLEALAASLADTEISAMYKIMSVLLSSKLPSR